MKLTCPYKFPARSRKAKVDFITGIGGYYSRDGRFPIEFNVSADRTNFEFDHLWKEYSKEHLPGEVVADEHLMSRYKALAERLLTYEVQHQLWEYGVEGSRRDLDRRECDTYYTLWSGEEIDAEWQLHGRNGKHAVLVRFEGRKFEGMSEDTLRDEMLSQTSNSGLTTVDDEGCLRPRWAWDFWTNKQIDLLYRYLAQCKQDFSSENVNKSVEYNGAYHFFCNIVGPEWETLQNDLQEHSEVVEAAQALHSALCGADVQPTVMDAFKVLCDAANVSQEEAEGY